MDHAVGGVTDKTLHIRRAAKAEAPRTD